MPPIANFLAAHPLVDQFDLSSLKTIGCGAAPLGGAIEEKLGKRIGCKVAQGYGMTESSGVITYPRFSAPIVQGCSGVLLPNTEGMIVDPTTGASLPAGATGELWFRGPQAFTGYLHNEDATRSTINAEGWVMTGDLGHFDEQGNVFITDRLKELIKVKGFQVAPAELEALLLTHPNIADVAVIGRPDERAGEVPVAFVVPRGDIDVEAVREWVAERVSEFKRLAAVNIIAAIPKTPSGRILRRVLRFMKRAHCLVLLALVSGCNRSSRCNRSMPSASITTRRRGLLRLVTRPDLPLAIVGDTQRISLGECVLFDREVNDDATKSILGDIARAKPGLLVIVGGILPKAPRACTGIGSTRS